MFLDRSWPIRGGAADIYMPLIVCLVGEKPDIELPGIVGARGDTV